MEWLPESTNVALIMVFAISNTWIKQAFAKIHTSKKVDLNAETKLHSDNQSNMKNFYSQADERS